MSDNDFVSNKTDENVSENSSDNVNFEYPSSYYCYKEKFALNKKDVIFAVLATAFSVLISLFGFFSGFALGYTIFVILYFMLFTVYFADKKSLNLFSVVCGLSVFLNSLVFVTTSNASVRFFGAIVILLSAITCFASANGEETKGNRASVKVFGSAFSSLNNITVSVKSLFSGGDKKSVGKVLIGVLCAIPILIIIIPLLIRSDDAFSGMLERIFGNSSGDIFKIIFGLLISPIFISYGFSLKYKRLSEIKKSDFKGIESIYVTSFLSAISFCYLFYLFSQLAYFFSAFKGFLPNGEITYSQYARKGFFEMCVIAVINLTVVFLSLLTAKKQNGKVSVGIKTSTTFISFFTLMIIATAISKMILYIKAYGMTVLRITTSTFMMFLAVIFVVAILKIYTNKINVVKIALLTAGAFVFLLGAVNVNSVCAKYNYESYKSQKLESIDIEALYYLGDEGIPYVVKLACSKDKEIAYKAQTYLAKAYKYDYFDNADLDKFTVNDLKQNQKNKGFAQFTLPKSKAYNELYKFIEANPDFCDFCYDYFTPVTEQFTEYFY